MGVGTVSRVINGSTAVSEATRRRVLDVVAELGYEPNATARALSTGRTRSIGVIAPFFTRPSVIERLRGVAPRAGRLGLPADPLRRREPRAARRRLPVADRPRRRADLDLARARPRGPGAPARRRRPDRARRPRARAAADRDRSTTSRAAAWPRSTCSSSATGGSPSPATRSTSVHGASASYRRCVGYQRALGRRRRRGAARARQGRARTGEDAAAIAADLLGARRARPPRSSPRPTSRRWRMIEAVAALGRRVPEDLSVVGFDDVELARYAGLTTVAQPLEISGTRGAELLLTALEGTEGSGPQPAPTARARRARNHRAAGRHRGGHTGRGLEAARNGMISPAFTT